MILDEIEGSRRLDKFRSCVKDLNQPDSTLRRFLKARNYDLDKAEDMLRKCIEWRRLNNVDDAPNWEFEEYLISQLPFEFTGVDYSNNAVIFLPYGVWNVRAMIEKGYRDDMEQYIYTALERVILNTEKSGEQFTLIVDMEGLNLWKMTHYQVAQLAIKTFKDFEANYPERLNTAIVINSPFVINYLWPLVKPLLTGNTVQKITFFGFDPTRYMPFILDLVPASSLPEKLLQLM